MTGLRIGCAGFPVHVSEYAPELGFVEIQETFDEGPELQEALKMTGRAAGGLGIGLVASKVITHPRNNPVWKTGGPDVPEHAAIGHFVRSRWTDEAWERIDSLARGLKAKVVVLRTPPSFRKTAANALALENFVAHAERPGLEFAWDPAGAWPANDATALCERLGLLLVADPATEKLPERDPLYVRFLGGKTGRGSLSEPSLDKVASAVRGRAGFVVFANSAAWEDSRRLAKIL